MNARMINSWKFCILVLFMLQQSIVLAGSTGVRLLGYIPATPGEVIELRVYPTYCFDGIDVYDVVTYSDTVDDGRFDFFIPSIMEPSYISLRFHSKENRGHSINLYLTEPGDEVTLTVTDTGLVFTGKGAAKYQCQYLVNQFIPQLTETHRKQVLAAGGKLDPRDSVMLSVFAGISDSVYREQLRLLSTFRSELSAPVYDRLYTDYLFDRPSKAMASLNSLSAAFTPDPEAKDRIHLQMLRSWLPKLSYAAGIDAEYLMRSSTFTDFALRALYGQLLIQGDRKAGISTFEHMKTLLDATFTGRLYQHLLAAMVVKYFNADVEPGLVADLRTKAFENPAHAHLVHRVLSAKAVGQPAVPFALSNRHGETVRLEDFSDKVVVMDFWFTGCTWCRVLEKHMKPIKDALKGDDRIVFLSINLDKDRRQWLNSVKSGQYTNPPAINLFTDGLRYKHPLPKFYGFMSAPQLLVLNHAHELVFDKTSFEETWFIRYVKGLAQQASP